jgi:hypothetical protein
MSDMLITSGGTCPLITDVIRKAINSNIDSMEPIFAEAIWKAHYVCFATVKSIVFHFSIDKVTDNGLTADKIDQYLKKHVNMRDSRFMITYKIDKPTD